MVLVPSNATPLQRTIDEAAAAAVDLPVPIADLIDAERAPMAALPFVAWGRSTDIWRDDWNEDQKRAVVDQFHDLHRFKGTLGGIRRHVNLTPGRILSATVPPQAFFCGGGDSESLWRKWLATLPELRLYSLREPGVEIGIVGAAGIDVDCAGLYLGAEEDGEPTFFAAGRGELEYAAIVVDGVEATIPFIREPDPRFGRAGEVMTFAWPQPAGLGLYLCDVHSADRFTRGSPADKAFAAVHYLDGLVGGSTWNLAVSSPYVQDIVPEIGIVDRYDVVGVYAGDFAADRYLNARDAYADTYRSLRLLTDVRKFGAPSSFLNIDRLGMEPFTAELLTEVPGTAPVRDLVTRDGFLSDGFALGAPDLSTLWQVCDAVAASKALRDRVFIDLDIPEPGTLRTARTFDDLRLR